ncbi:MAG: leucine--tRNA ligase [Candidatus Peregrinibacteria bacterium]|nr:leucine--tRNA ligase [Candidatus Peregrinibacteria bacterium]
MQEFYDPTAVETKWQEKWAKAKLHSADLQNAKKPYYALVMFPYPSGDKLHVGHWYNFAPADSAARYTRMKGFNVFEPMGFDAFGLPAENYAIKTGVPPAQSTAKNVETMIKQLTRIGTMYDWEKLVNTSDPSYYRWTQWLFLQMYKNNLAYKKMGMVNFCPSCQTVLANEQVWEGKCERCETEVVQKPLEQWYWKITNYAQKLVDNLDQLDWPKKTKVMQQNWIGRKVGIDITYEIEGTTEKIVCFTTRPDTNFGATFIVIAPEHPFAKKVAGGELKSQGGDHASEVSTYAQQAAKKTELDRQAEGRKKTGVFTGFSAVNSLNGKKLPIWVSDFVLAGFGTGAVVGVPGHDVRDFEFATQFGIPVVRVVVASDGDTSPITSAEQVQEKEGKMINSSFLDGLDIREATVRIMDHLEENGWGKRVTTYRLRDWLISRQRYWGAPIPIVYDPEGKAHPIPEKHLPWLLPTDVEFKPTGKSPLTESKEFIARTEKIFGKGWRPEFDTMDTFVCSSFYYLRYLMPNPNPNPNPPSKKDFIDPALEKKWMPVSMYIGGPEHACMHLIYARFVMMALKDFGLVSHEEPFQRLVHQGLITNKGAKMSKSKGNVVSPDSFIDRHGSDVFRMYLMFMGPFTDGGDWSDTGIKGIDRFVQRVWRLFSSSLDEGKKSNKKVDQKDADTERALHRTIKAVTDSLERLHFNTAISSLMEFLNLLEAKGSLTPDIAKTFALLLGPLAPHLADELWEMTGGKGFVVEQSWPTFDPAMTVFDEVTVAIQVNGKLRGEVVVGANAPQEEVLNVAKAHENVQKYIEGKTLKKEIYVPGKLVSLVV